MRTIMQTLDRIALSDLGVLVVGEEGTGKKWLAKMIHQVSGRARSPFLWVDCKTLNRETLEKEIFGSEELTFSGIEITRGAVERAYGGTIFFENVEELPALLQMKIARVLEHQHFRRVGGFEEIGVNVRIITTSRTKPAVLEDDGIDKTEIYHRMCPVILNLPPLRERREDILFLIEKFIMETTTDRANRPKGITGSALRTCLEYHWPGNARELKVAIKHAARICSDQFIRKNHLPVYLQDYNKRVNGVTVEETEQF
ncbi:MAG: sigma-54-dependent Fis family transcriptional regulator [Ignavibacteria bacterium]|nr:sigma-54-dependent Fis family transcriptional regulator [Ignavibacteria bacterium]